MAKAMEDYTDQELQKMIRVMRTILIIMGVIALLYVAYFGYLMVAGKLDGSKMIGVVPMLGMLVAGLPTMINMNRFKAELSKRAQG